MPGRLESVHPGHFDIGNHHIRFFPVYQVYQFLAVGGFSYQLYIALFLDHYLEAVAEDLIVRASTAPPPTRQA